MATCEFAIKELYINRDFRYRKSKIQQKFTVGAGFTRANITFKVRVAKLSECNVSELKTWQKIRTELRIEEVAVYKTILLERMLRHFSGLLENANDLLLALYKSPEAATGSELEQSMTQMTLDPGDLQAEGETEEAGLLETALFPRCVILEGEEFYSNKPDEDFVVEFQGHEGTAGGIEDSDD
ncbi:hypothetical protein ECANGB1_1290 [Enterospora canceri]|uniref:Uncharacterized protein n=1 Tax=Enterospora canceri TaxID=1081671 RepID=A0A1Y1S421_9MICR|nr:hypothetical protein ECANGB1_1290 [Enterospora canceri]